jgi:hypothetical protein
MSTDGTTSPSIEEDKTQQSSFKKYIDIFVLKNPFQNHMNYSKNIKKIFEELKKT